MKNTTINRKATKKVAHALGELNTRVVYVGGAIVSLYIDDSSAEDVRPTKDIDITLEIASLTELETLRDALQQKGFYQHYEDDVICRFRYEDVKVDVMSTRAIGWAPANPWFEAGFKKAQTLLIEEAEIRIMPLPYYLASKFSAFYSRGTKDPRTSKDFEDIVYLLNYSSTLEMSILDSGKDVKIFLKDAFTNILKDEGLQEAIIANLYYEEQMVRYQKIIDRLIQITHAL